MSRNAGPSSQSCGDDASRQRGWGIARHTTRLTSCKTAPTRCMANEPRWHRAAASRAQRAGAACPPPGGPPVRHVGRPTSPAREAAQHSQCSCERAQQPCRRMILPALATVRAQLLRGAVSFSQGGGGNRQQAQVAHPAAQRRVLGAPGVSRALRERWVTLQTRSRRTWFFDSNCAT